MKAGPLRKIYSGQLVDILEGITHFASQELQSQCLTSNVECLSACPEDRPAACLLRNTARRQLGSRLVDPHPPHLVGTGEPLRHIFLILIRAILRRFPNQCVDLAKHVWTG